MRHTRLAALLFIVASIFNASFAAAESASSYCFDAVAHADWLLKRATQGVKDKDDHYAIPPTPALAKMTEAERAAFIRIIKVVQFGNKAEFDRMKGEDIDSSENPLHVVGFHIVLSALTKHMLAIRFSDTTTTEKLCAGKLMPPPSDPIHDESRSRALYNHWWQVSADFVAEFACKK